MYHCVSRLTKLKELSNMAMDNTITYHVCLVLVGCQRSNEPLSTRLALYVLAVAAIRFSRAVNDRYSIARDAVHVRGDEDDDAGFT